ncbi:MAG: GNAT family N-acetyltransferase [Anaerolineales bacterium]|nr:GNAT family N-acetyltransferase [Anaerolineales bacterium]
MKTTRTDIEHWWAVEAMIASYNHVYNVVYGTRYHETGPIGVSIYADAPIASFHYEFLALSADIRKVTDAIRAYPIPADKKHIVNIFHPAPVDHSLKEHFSKLGHEFVRTGPLLGFDLPLKVSTIPLNIHKAKTIQQTEAANNSLTSEGERIHLQTLRDKHIHNFYVKEAGQAVGWVQLVTKYPKVGYINQLYVMEEFRQRRFASILIHAAHSEAIKLGVKRMVAIPSDMSLHLFRRMGYRPLLYFSAFRPKPRRKPWVYDQPSLPLSQA